jgi:hypothetical protein
MDVGHDEVLRAFRLRTTTDPSMPIDPRVERGLSLYLTWHDGDELFRDLFGDGWDSPASSSDERFSLLRRIASQWQAFIDRDETAELLDELSEAEAVTRGNPAAASGVRILKFAVGEAQRSGMVLETLTD